MQFSQCHEQTTTHNVADVSSVGLRNIDYKC